MINSRAACSLAAILLLAACSGGNGGGSTPSPVSAPGGGGAQPSSQMAISVTNSFGSPMKSLSAYNADISTSAASGASQMRPMTSGSGTCNNGVEFFSPDKNGDPNSTETQYFYDAACTELARDVVRIFSPTGPNSETVARTVSLYAIGNSTAIATRSDSVTITNATFDQYGFPLAADGFDRVSSNALNISGAKTIVSDDELVMLAGTASQQYCGDSAGYNATGFAKLGMTFGWAGISSNGTRTVNSNGSVTWTVTHAGSSFKGAIGSLSIATGPQNSTCPIATPMFTLAGGTAVGTYSIPVSATYQAGILINLTISGATLSNGYSLTVTTNTGVLPTNSQFILGTISNGSSQVATFAVDCFGDGTLTVTATGTQYVITDWQVVH